MQVQNRMLKFRLNPVFVTEPEIKQEEIEPELKIVSVEGVKYQLLMQKGKPILKLVTE